MHKKVLVTIAALALSASTAMAALNMTTTPLSADDVSCVNSSLSASTKSQIYQISPIVGWGDGAAFQWNYDASFELQNAGSSTGGVLVTKQLCIYGGACGAEETVSTFEPVIAHASHTFRVVGNNSGLVDGTNYTETFYANPSVAMTCGHFNVNTLRNHN